ncbi:MAG: hypothetical protein Q9168_001482 [Polycauliona sp. 1 TL-2023]
MKEAIWISLAIVAASYWIFDHFWAVKHDPQEPPLVPSKIPLVGHLIGLILRKNEYYVHLRRKHSLPIYTLPMVTSKLYVVNSVDLISSIQRLPKILAFAPLEAKFATIMCASSREGNEIIANNLNCEGGDWGYSHDLHKSMNSALAPGAGLDGMNRIMIQNIARSLDKLKPRESQIMEIKLGEWSRHEITMATTNSVYGECNPFTDPKIENAFWDFESGLVMILVDRLPFLTARKACRARDLVGDAFRLYFEAKHHERGSMLVQKRYNTSIENKVSVADIARFEVGNSIAVLVNTAPAVFWMLYYLYSNPVALEDCRNEVESIVSDTKGINGARKTVDITIVKQNCPLLTSALQEVLRQRTLGIQVRQVMEDTMLDGKYLLKKDATVLIPSLVMHTDPAIWGPDVSEFKPQRFTKGGTMRQSHKPDPKALRIFGGGTTLCPGRHFATTEILATVVMFILRYELLPVDGYWAPPKTEKSNIAAVVMEPDSDITVRVVPRECTAGYEWDFKLPDSNMVFEVAAEDRHD